ncbi:MAG: chromosome partitioning protein ParB, partial [Monoglobus pectinilyticus]
LKLEAMKRQGERTDLTSAQFVPKLTVREKVAQEAGINRMEITSYIRLTNLIDPLLEMVDEKKIALNAAVELSYLGSKEQAEVLNSIEKEEASPSIAQAAKMRRFSQNGKLNPDVIDSIMQEQKPEKIKITLAGDKVKKYFPEDYTEKQIEDVMIKLLDDWYKKRQRKKEYER